ncbi:hypothetical protein BYT27DRAFT_7239968 [Phlegmacium glaucopus]|nr:hypothetical protein BYT27DRAFT_7239968 [Phlegmacium glaucopus]
MNSDEVKDVKLPLPKFLKLFTNNNVPIPKAMAIASKIYKEYNTPLKLGQLSEVKLKAAGIEDKDDRSLIMQTLRKVGYAYKGESLKRTKDSPALTATSSESSVSASGSQSAAVNALTTPPKRKRGRAGGESNEFLPEGSPDEAANFSSLSFNEIVDEKILMTKSTVINRAPVMTAWATFVAERMHFTREEALSIASVYTELNAVSKGTSLGIFKKDDDRGVEAAKDGSQPYVELMGRRPLYRSQNGQWRALNNGRPVQPSAAFSYISRAFRQTTSHITGALKLLAESYTPEELNAKAWALYAQFRPEVNEWGKRSEVSCSRILALRKQQAESRPSTKTNEPTPAISGLEASERSGSDDGSPRKKARVLIEEIEREAALNQNTIWDDIEPDFDFMAETPEYI